MDTAALYQIYKDCGGRVSIDSRSVRGGEMFFALKGSNFDGNAYAIKALEAGAARAVVNADSEAATSGHPGIIAVEDSFIALRELAKWHREHSLVDGKRLKVIGLTGTNGKTTTKELIREVLSCKFTVTATEGNLNNDIGVPLTLLKIRPETEIAVIEMGASHPDDISALTKVCEPDYGLITNVGKAHLQGFGSYEGVKRAKGQLYDWIQEHGGEIFLNVDDPVLVEMASQRKSLRTNDYGLKFWGGMVLPSDSLHPYARFTIPTIGNDVCDTHLVGAYNVANAMAAIAIGLHFGISAEEAVKAIASYEPKNNRSQMVRTASNVLIVDAYNANPTSMSASLDNFDNAQASSKLALLGMMGELGTDSVEEHAAIVRRVAEADYDCILVGPQFMEAMRLVGGKALELKWFQDSEALANHLQKNPVTGRLILVKGSRSQAMEKVVPVL